MAGDVSSRMIQIRIAIVATVCITVFIQAQPVLAAPLHATAQRGCGLARCTLTRILPRQTKLPVVISTPPQFNKKRAV
jgi:hypothetical protein